MFSRKLNRLIHISEWGMGLTPSSPHYNPRRMQITAQEIQEDTSPTAYTTTIHPDGSETIEDKYIFEE
jgi:hypothetical protein